MSKRCEDTVSIRLERDSDTFRQLTELKAVSGLSFRQIVKLSVQDFYDKRHDPAGSITLEDLDDLHSVPRGTTEMLMMQRLT